MNEIQQLIRSGDSFAAVEQLQRHGSPLEIGARYHALLRDLYWKEKDLPAMVIIGRAGILFCLTQSHATGLTAQDAEQLRSTAKGLAYDIGSFTWPGWEEPGINPTPDEIAFGHDCARLNLRLAIELKKPLSRVSMAHWLLGAHELAAHAFQSAIKQFQLAQEVLPATSPESKANEPLNTGYLMIARLSANSSDTEARSKFDEIIASLSTRSDEEARDFSTQLATAHRHFTKKP
jgi:hypothetical protein